MQLSHGSRFFDSHNMQKCVTQIIYLWPLPRGWVAGPKRGKQEDEDTDLATVQKGPSTLCICDVLAGAHIWNHIAYLLHIGHIV